MNDFYNIYNDTVKSNKPGKDICNNCNSVIVTQKKSMQGSSVNTQGGVPSQWQSGK